SANRDFESEMEDHETTLIAPPAQQAPGPGAQPRSVPTNSVVGRLRIPRLHLSTMIREGVDEKTLSLAPGHIPGTASPGESGNVGVAGHRDRLFRALKDIRNNDLIIFETLAGKFVYQVAGTEVVKP